MRNISELIGIIKGISFDGIINDKEVECLQNWVDKNRNLSYDKKQAKMIKLVDEVLADHIVTDEERKQLLDYCEEYLKNSDDVNASIYELNGIITGIISDGVVNTDEVIKLKQWMDENSYAVRGHKPSEEILLLVEEILKDGVVTEKEQKQLLDLLSAKIDDTQLKTKINYLKQLVRERKNIGLDLIDILDNKEAISDIHSQAEKYLESVLNSYSGIMTNSEYRETVFISLCLIALLKYDGNYYDHVADTYKTIYRKYPYLRIEGAIRNVLASYIVDNVQKRNIPRLINIALANAIVPAYFLSAFFEFVFDIYKLNFEYDIPRDLYEEFKFVYEGLSDTMSFDSDEIQVNVTKKTYKLIRSTKRLITDRNSIDTIIKLSIIIVKLIDKRYWGKDYKIFNPYLYRGFNEWEKTLVIDKTDVKRDYDGFKSRWMPKLQLDKKSIYLVPPVHRVKSRYAFYKIFVVVKNGDEVICLDNRPEIREIIGGYQVSPKRIKLNSPLGKVRYLLKVGDEVIYDSTDSLYRNYIIFDREGKEIKNNTDYKGVAHICASDNEQRGKTYLRTQNYSLTELNVDYGDLLAFGKEIFSFSALSRPGVFGEKREHQFLKEKGNEELLPVFSKVKFLVFEHENSVKNFLITINQRNFKLDDFQYTRTIRKASTKYVVDLNILYYDIYELAVYAIKKGSRSKIYNFRFGYDPRFVLTEEKIDNIHYAIKAKSGLYGKKEINKEIDIRNFSDDWLIMKRRGVNYNYYLPLHLEIYRLKNGLWKSMAEDLWIEDIEQDSVLQVLGDYADCLMVESETGAEVLEKVQGKDCGIYCEIPIGFLTSYKKTNKYVILRFQKDEERVGSTYCCNQCFFDKQKTEIKFDPINKSLNILPVYRGKGNVILEVKDEGEAVIYNDCQITSGMPIEIKNIRSFVDYKVSFYEMPKGSETDDRKELLSIRRSFYAWKDLLGYYARVKEVHYRLNKNRTKLKHLFENLYLNFEKRLSEDTYSGALLIKKDNAMIILKDLKQLQIQICSDIINGELDLDITRHGNNLLLDFDNQWILRSAYNNRTARIDSFTVEITSKPKIESVKTKSGNNNRHTIKKRGFDAFNEADQLTVIKTEPSERSIVNAGPGTGKTWTLIEKIIFMIENELVSARDILVLCYSRAAVAVIRQRLSSEAASGRLSYEWKNVEVRTFDSFSTQLIYLIAEDLPELLPPDFKIEYAGYDRRIEVATSILKKGQGLLDEYNHIFVDEVQDLVGCRAELVLAMLKGLPDTCGFTVLGDSCQSLYDYLSEKDNKIMPSKVFYRELFKLFPDANYFTLTENHRQSSSYSDLTEPYRKAILAEDVTALTEIAEDIHDRIARVSFERWQDFSKAEAKKFIKRGTLGILTRSNAQALLISSALRLQGVPHLLKRMHDTHQLNAWIADMFYDYPNATIDESGFQERQRRLFPELDSETAAERWGALSDTQRNVVKKRYEIEDLLKGLLTNAKATELFISQEDKPCPVTVSTIHRAKGMEFDSVIVVDDVLENVFGRDADNILEHKVCYVALTRPKELIKRAEPLHRKGNIYRNDTERFIRKIPSFKPYLKSFEVGVETDLDANSFAETKKRQSYICKNINPGMRLKLIKCPNGCRPYIMYKVVPVDDELNIIGYTSEVFSEELEAAIKEIKRLPYYARVFYEIYPDVFDDIYVDSIISCVSHNSGLPGAKNYGGMSIWKGFSITGFANVVIEY